MEILVSGTLCILAKTGEQGTTLLPSSEHNITAVHCACAAAISAEIT